MAQVVRAQLFCDEMQWLLNENRFEQLAHWLTPIAESNRLAGLDALRDAARCLAAVVAPVAPERQRESLGDAKRHLARLQAQLTDDHSVWANELRASLPAWQQVAAALDRVAGG